MAYDDSVTRCAYCKGIVETAHARYVEFHPTVVGRVVVFHAGCEAKRGTPPPASNVVSLGKKPQKRVEPDDYDD